jgi:NADH-ubiquinone oxidoreductase chain 1
MTEHAAVIFVFFFLAEYASIVLICILTSILFIGGYLFIDYSYLLYPISYANIHINIDYINILTDNPFVEGLFYGLNLGIKSSIMIFVFI